MFLRTVDFNKMFARGYADIDGIRDVLFFKIAEVSGQLWWIGALQRTIKLYNHNNVVAVLPPPPVLTLMPVDCPTDIVFVVDESGSVGSHRFSLMKSFLSQLVSRLDIDSGNTRVGLVTFATNVGTVFNLNAHSSVASLQSAISLLGYKGGLTNTFVGLRYVRTMMLTSAAGNRNNVRNTVVVVTGGASRSFTATVVSCFSFSTSVREIVYWDRYANGCSVNGNVRVPWLNGWNDWNSLPFNSEVRLR